MRQMTIRIDDHTYEQLRLQGERLGIGTATVARIWLKETAEMISPPPPRRSARAVPDEIPSSSSGLNRKNPEGTRAERRAKKRGK